MALTVKPGIIDTQTATAAVEANRFIAVTSHCGAGARASGISHDGADTGGAFGVVTSGIFLLMAGATVTAGQELESDADGKGIPLASGKGNAFALTGGATGEVLRVKII